VTAAAITGDIVNFTRLTAPAQKKLVADLSKLMHNYKFDFYRGDSFNVYARQPKEALRLVLQLRTSARKLIRDAATPETDIRVSIGIGEVNAPVRTLRTATGGAFTLSGRNLDAITRSGERLTIVSENTAINPALKVIASFMDYLLNRLTAKQAEVVFELSGNLTQTEVAERLHKSQATINQHVQSSGWNEMEKLLEEYESLNFINK
jgi:hypothetical protein